ENEAPGRAVARIPNQPDSEHSRAKNNNRDLATVIEAWPKIPDTVKDRNRRYSSGADGTVSTFCRMVRRRLCALQTAGWHSASLFQRFRTATGLQEPLLCSHHY